ncbi:hypothetical protein ACHWQZ_G003432 [Mnemiopsis leidyi]
MGGLSPGQNRPSLLGRALLAKTGLIMSATLKLVVIAAFLGLIALSKADDDGLVIEDGEMTVSELFELLESRSANRAKRSMRRRGSSGDSLCKQVCGNQSCFQFRGHAACY